MSELLSPCIECGEPSEEAYCEDHKPPAQVKAPSNARGYTSTWRRISKRARRLQPFCLDCGARTDLTADHSPEAWAAHEQGKPITLDLIDVVCRSCNSKRGAARGENARPGFAQELPRGEGAEHATGTPPAKASPLIHRI